MRTQARLAPSLQDDVIYRRLNAQADSLLTGAHPGSRLPGVGHPNRIVIQAEYTDQVDLPLFKHTFVLRPRAEEAALASAMHDLSIPSLFLVLAGNARCRQAAG